MADRFTLRLLLLKIALPFIYTGFFIVQQCINFDTTLDQRCERYQVIERFLPSTHAVSLEKSPGHHPVKTKFRLNKSFQPAVLTYTSAIICRPVVQLAALGQVLRDQPFITSPLRHASLLRGPPLCALIIL